MGIHRRRGIAGGKAAAVTARRYPLRKVVGWENGGELLECGHVQRQVWDIYDDHAESWEGREVAVYPSSAEGGVRIRYITEGCTHGTMRDLCACTAYVNVPPPALQEKEEA